MPRLDELAFSPFPSFPFFLPRSRQEITINTRAVRVDGYGDRAGLGRVEDFGADALVGVFCGGWIPASAAAYDDPAGRAPGDQAGRIAAAGAMFCACVGMR